MLPSCPQLQRLSFGICLLLIKQNVIKLLLDNDRKISLYLADFPFLPPCSGFANSVCYDWSVVTTEMKTNDQLLVHAISLEILFSGNFVDEYKFLSLFLL